MVEELFGDLYSKEGGFIELDWGPQYVPDDEFTADMVQAAAFGMKAGNLSDNDGLNKGILIALSDGALS